MNKTLPLCALMLTLALTTTVKAQLYKITLDQKVAAATFIAEGKVISQTSFWNDAHSMIFTSNTVEVYKTFKGKTTSTTIEVMTQGGSVGTDAVAVSDLLALRKNQTGIFFVMKTVWG